MRISITSGSTTHHLAGQSGVSERVHSSAGDLQISAAIATQANGGVRRLNAGVIDRNNLSTVISFTTSRTFANPDAAALWALDYDSAFIRAGVVALVAGATTRYLREAVVEPPARQVIGCTVNLRYTIRGGGIFSSAS